MQCIANKYQRQVVCVYGVAGHGKGEVDHVGGVAKVAVREDIARGSYFANAEEVVSFLRDKFGEQQFPKYHITEIPTGDLEMLRHSASHLVFKTVQGSSSFHLVIFKPGTATFKAATQYCICATCQTEFGSCPLLNEYVLSVEPIYPPSLRSEKLVPVTTEDEDCEVAGFITPESIVAVAAAKNSPDTIWFIKVTGIKSLNMKSSMVNDYGHVIPPGMEYMKGHFLEREDSNNQTTIFKAAKKVTYFYKETVVYPFVEMEEGKRGFVEMEEGKRRLILKNQGYIYIICHVEQTGFAHL